MAKGLSGSTIKSWFQYRCERKTRYEIMEPAELAAVPVAKDDREKPWAVLGIDFEDRVVQRLSRECGVLRPSQGDRDGLPESVAAAFLRGKGSATYAAQVKLKPRGRPGFLAGDLFLRRSFADIVRRDLSGPVPVFRVIDIKASRGARAFHKTQVAFYALLLEAILVENGIAGRIDPKGEIWRIPDDGDAEGDRAQIEEFDLEPYRRLVRDFCSAVLPGIASKRVEPGCDETFFHVYFKCEQCAYLPHCIQAVGPQRAPHVRDVSAVAGLSHESKRSLLSVGAYTVSRLADMGAGVGRMDGAGWALARRAETLVARGGENVGAFIEDVLDEQLRMGGIAPADPRVTRRRRDGAIQRCFSHVVQGRTRASCTSAYIDEAGTDLVLDMVRCEAERPGAATCARVLDTLASSGAKMGLDRTLEATRSPGLPDVTPDGLAWIRLGATRGELEAACVDAGGRLEAPDMRGAPPALLAAAATGRILACADGGSSSLGRIELVHASFDEEGRVVEAGVWVPADHAELTATLERAYPDYLPAEAMRMNVYFVNRDATGYGLFAISSSPSTVRPGRTILSVKSRRSYDSPPF